MVSDSELVARCLRGNKTAWSTLVTRYARLVYSIPYRYGLTPLDCDEVFQSVFLIAYRKLETLRDKRLLAAWLRTITYNETNHRLRLRSKNDNLADLSEESIGADDSPVEIAERLEKQHIVRAALDALGDPCRTLLYLLFLNDDPSSYRDVAVRLGIPLGSIGPRRQRCFVKLLRILVDEFEFQL